MMTAVIGQVRIRAACRRERRVSASSSPCAPGARPHNDSVAVLEDRRRSRRLQCEERDARRMPRSRAEFMRGYIVTCPWCHEHERRAPENVRNDESCEDPIRNGDASCARGIAPACRLMLAPARRRRSRSRSRTTSSCPSGKSMAREDRRRARTVELLLTRSRAGRAGLLHQTI